jgi:hypothetical protein
MTKGGLVIFWVFIIQSISAQLMEPLQFHEKVHDFGEVLEAEGVATYDFVFTNIGARAIKILSVDASCGCTTPDWTKDPVAVGKTGFVRIHFDPSGKPGYFNKSVNLTTDASAQPIVLQIKGTVVSERTDRTQALPAVNGSLRLRSNSFNLGKIFINKPNAVAEFEMLNSGKQVIQITRASFPTYLKVETPRSLAPGEKGVIKIWLDAKAHDRFGFISENIHLTTTDPLLEEKYFSVYATIEEFFPVLKPEEVANAPALKLSFLSFDLGRLAQGVTVHRQVVLKNTGKSDLLIRDVQGNCTCLTVSLVHKKLKPGQETELTIGFTTEGRGSNQQKAVTIYSNDPKTPVQRVILTAYVED